MSAPLLETARIGRTHGTDGFVRVYPFSDDYSHLLKLEECVVKFPSGEELTLRIEGVEKKSGFLLMKFALYPTPEKARFLASSVILIPREKAPSLKKGEYYVADLYGMDVIYEGRVVGKIEYTMEGAQSLLLCVRRIDNNKEYLVPDLPVYVKDVSVHDNSLVLINPELMEL